VLASQEWHPGVIGIVAGRLAEEYCRPVMLFGQVRSKDQLFALEDASEAIAQGSGRSCADFPLHEALRECDDLLLSHGGHAAAAGCRIQFTQIDAFRERFASVARRYFPSGPPGPRLTIDAEVPLSALTHRLVQDLDRLEPYGADNRRPLFLAGGLQIVGEPAKVGGGDRHMSVKVKQQGSLLRAIAFSLADRYEELMSSAGQCCLVFTPRINEWNGFRRIDLEVVDFQAGLRAKLG
jgi:single-stranded-DNA-specific exonuclease